MATSTSQWQYRNVLVRLSTRESGAGREDGAIGPRRGFDPIASTHVVTRRSGPFSASMHMQLLDRLRLPCSLSSPTKAEQSGRTRFHMLFQIPFAR
jgi:hypothetical protein